MASAPCALGVNRRGAIANRQGTEAAVVIDDWPWTTRRRRGARGRIRTGTGDVLDVVPLRVGLREQWRNAVDLHHTPRIPRSALLSRQARRAGPVDIPGNWSAWQELHLQPSHLERDASGWLGYTRLVPTAGLAPALGAV